MRIHRVAPLISSPQNMVKIIKKIVPAYPTMAIRRMVLRFCIERKIISATAIGINTSWRFTKWKLSAPIRLATAGPAEKFRNTPINTNTPINSNKVLSTVHHQFPNKLRLLRENVNNFAPSLHTTY